MYIRVDLNGSAYVTRMRMNTSRTYAFVYGLFVGYLRADVDECALGQYDCTRGQRCENTPGSYMCRRDISCGTGYTLQESTQICIGQSQIRRTRACMSDIFSLLQYHGFPIYFFRFYFRAFAGVIQLSLFITFYARTSDEQFNINS